MSGPLVGVWCEHGLSVCVPCDRPKTKRIRALEAEVARLGADLAAARDHLRRHGCDFMHTGTKPSDCPECQPPGFRTFK